MMTEAIPLFHGIRGVPTGPIGNPSYPKSADYPGHEIRMIADAACAALTGASHQAPETHCEIRCAAGEWEFVGTLSRIAPDPSMLMGNV